MGRGRPAGRRSLRTRPARWAGRWLAGALAAAVLAGSAVPGVAQPADREARRQALIREVTAELQRVQVYLAYTDQILRMELGRGALSPETAASHLAESGQALYERSYTDHDLDALLVHHRAAAEAYFQRIEAAIAASRQWPPGGAPAEWQARARTQLRQAAADYAAKIGRREDVRPELRRANEALAWASGFATLPPELNHFAGQWSRVISALPSGVAQALTEPPRTAGPPAAGPGPAPGLPPSAPSPPAGPQAGGPPGGTPAEPPRPAPELQPGEDESAFWRRVYAADSREGYEAYLRLFPRGQYVDIARVALAGRAPGAPPPADGPGPVSPGPAVPTAPPPGGAAQARALEEQGNALFGRWQFREALVAYDGALGADPSLIAARVGRGRSLNALGDIAGAGQAYQDVLRLDPALAHVRAWLAEIRLAAGDLDGARAAIQDELARDPGSAWARSFEGTLHLLQGRQAEAQRAMAEARRLDPAVAAQRYRNGEFLGALGQHHRALIEFSTVLALDPDMAGAYYAVGLSAAHVGATAQAVQAFEAYLQRDSTGDWAQRAREHLARLRGGAPPANPAGHPPGIGVTCPPNTIPAGGGCLPAR